MNSSDAQKMDQTNEESILSDEVSSINSGAANHITQEDGKWDEPTSSTTAGGSNSYKKRRDMSNFRRVNLESSETDSDFEDWEEFKRPVRMANTKLIREMEATFKNVIEEFEEMYIAENRPLSRRGVAAKQPLTKGKANVGSSNRSKRKVEDIKAKDINNPREPTNKKQKNE